MSDGVGLSRTNRGPIRYDRSTLIPVTRLTIFPCLHPINPLHEYLFLFFTSLSLCLILTLIYHVHVVNPVHIHHPYLHLYIPSILNQVSPKSAIMLCYPYSSMCAPVLQKWDPNQNKLVIITKAGDKKLLRMTRRLTEWLICTPRFGKQDPFTV